jgi:hypothetical protein
MTLRHVHRRPPPKRTSLGPATVVADSVGPSPGRDATIEFAVKVWIDPSSAVTPWGPAGTHVLFQRVVRISDGSWRLVESGTGP